MKYCIMSNLSFDTPAKRSNLSQAIRDKIVARMVWGKVTIVDSTDENNFPASNVEIRFDNETDMVEVFDFIKGRMEKIPVLKGFVSKHLCYHDEGYGHKRCDNWERFNK